MANTVQITVEQDGPSDTVYTVYLESDGSSGELTNQTIIDPATLYNEAARSSGTQGFPNNAPLLNIQQVWYFLSGFDVVVQFGGAVPMKRLLLTPSVDSYQDFRPMGGLADKTPSANSPNGKLQINTNGFSSSGCFGTIIFKVRKMK